jgi:methionyl-tRNA formyltransferase
MNIVYFGSSEFAVLPLKSLIEAGADICCVVTQPDKQKGRGLRVEGTPVKKTAKEAGLEIYQPAGINTKEAADFLKKLKPDLFVVIAYGQILSQAILDIPKIFSVNTHASLLPKYRGAAPINWAIVKGEKVTGISVIRMNSRMDAGDILLQKRTDIDDCDTTATLSVKLSGLAALLLLESLSAIENKKINPVKQKDAEVSFAPLLKKEDGLVDWGKTAQELHNLVRGLYPWPGAFTYHKGRLIKICVSKVRGSGGLRAQPGEIIEAEKSGIIVGTKSGLLEILELQPEGKRRMTAAEFISGHKLKAGQLLGKI